MSRRGDGSANGSGSEGRGPAARRLDGANSGPISGHTPPLLSALANITPSGSPASPGILPPSGKWLDGNDRGPVAE